MIKKQSLRITESDLHKIIKESVKRVLNEIDYKTYLNAANKAHSINDPRSSKFRDAAIDRFNKDYGYDDGNASLKAKSAYEDGFNDWRVQRNGKPINPLTKDSPHMSLHYDYDDGNGYREYAKTSTDLENDLDRSIHGDAEGYGGMSSGPIRHFPSGGNEEFEPGKWRGKNDDAFNEFDNYRKGKYTYDKGKGYRLK